MATDETPPLPSTTAAPSSSDESAGPYRDVIRSVRWSPDEWSEIQRQAKLSGQPPASYVRMAALGQKVRARRSVIEKEAVHQLARIGSNLNQITRTLHELRKVSASPLAVQVLEELGELDPSAVLREVNELARELGR